MAVTTLTITGMHCAGCVNSVEKVLVSVPGVDRAMVNLVAGQARIEHQFQPGEVDAFINAVHRAGYGAHAIEADSSDPFGLEGLGQGQAWRWTTWTLCAVGAGVIVGLNQWESPFSPWVQLVLATPIVLFLGGVFYRGAYRSVRRMRADMDTLVTLGTGVAFVYSCTATVMDFDPVYFNTAAVILVLVSLGRLIEQRARHKSCSAVAALLQVQVSEATVTRHGERITIPVDEVVVGDTVLVRPGQGVPVDGIVTDGESSVDQSLVTGESEPRAVSAGAEVIGGTMNQSGAIRLRATRTGSETLLAQMAGLVHQAQSTKAAVQRAADDVAAVFVPAVIFVALQTWFLWGLFTDGWANGLEPMIAVLIIACPCVVGLATPTVMAVATGLGARRGILIKDAAALERGGRISHVLLDKTGTLTTGRFIVGAFKSFDKTINTTEMLQVVASVEELSQHQIGRAIAAYARQQKLKILPVNGFENLSVGGVKGRVGARSVLIARLPTLRDQQVHEVERFVEKSKQMAEICRTVIGVAIDGRAVGLIGLHDMPRPEASGVVNTLRHRLGLEVMVISGDSETATKRLAEDLGVGQFEAQVLATGKQAHVARIQGDGGVVAMVGDGVNDAPALAEADIGVAMGAGVRAGMNHLGGTDIAMRAGHVVLISGDLRGLVRILTLSRATMRRIYFGLFWAFAYNVLLIPVAAFGWLNPMFAAAAMSASSICVVLNAGWLRYAWKPDR